MLPWWHVHPPNLHFTFCIEPLILLLFLVPSCLIIMGLLSSITNAFWPSDHEGGENLVRQEIVSEA